MIDDIADSGPQWFIRIEISDRSGEPLRWHDVDAVTLSEVLGDLIAVTSA